MKSEERIKRMAKMVEKESEIEKITIFPEFSKIKTQLMNIKIAVHEIDMLLDDIMHSELKSAFKEKSGDKDAR